MQNSCAGAIVAAGFAALPLSAAAQDLPQCDRFPGGGAVYQCSCGQGDATGSVWGSGPYTGDSSLCAAAVHAGVIADSGGAILVVPRPGEAAYEGSARNGITTSSWGAYELSIEIRRVKGAPLPDQTGSGDLADCAGFPSDADRVACKCAAGSFDGAVWGSDPYTLDSDLCAAARHVGYITDEGGIVRALRLGGLDSYLGTMDNGVTTRDWGSYDSSFVFDWNH